MMFRITPLKKSHSSFKSLGLCLCPQLMDESHHPVHYPLWGYMMIKFWSTMVQVMACCLTATSHYPEQCWLDIIGTVKFPRKDMHIRFLKVFVPVPRHKELNTIQQTQLKCWPSMVRYGQCHFICINRVVFFFRSGFDCSTEGGTAGTITI